MHYEEFRDHAYLGAWNFMDGDRTLTIDRVVQGYIDREDGTKERVPLLYFVELTLPLVLNSTNGKMIYMMFGTPDVRQWAGKRITLTTALTTNTSGQPVMGIRVHPQRPADAPVVQETADQKMRRLEVELAKLRGLDSPEDDARNTVVGKEITDAERSSPEALKAAIAKEVAHAAG